MEELEFLATAAARAISLLPRSKPADIPEWKQYSACLPVDIGWKRGATAMMIPALMEAVVTNEFAQYLTPYAPLGGAECAIRECDGVFVRAIAQYEISKDRTLYRLDVLGSK